MPSPILARADALMQRRRQGETGPLDDVPVLTDTVESDDAAPLFAKPSHDQTCSPPLDGIAEALSLRIQQRLAAELPSLIETTVREFLAEQKHPMESSHKD